MRTCFKVFVIIKKLFSTGSFLGIIIAGMEKFNLSL